MGILSASYPGAERIKSVRITCAHDGWVVALMRLVPQSSLPALNGSLVLSDGINDVTLSACRVDRSNIQFSGNGHVEVVQLLGRTWKWRFGTIDGTYNVRRPDGTVDPDTEKSPQQLAQLLWQALGESSADVGDLPNSALDRPFVNWECEDARGALHWLCERAGCSFGLDVGQDSAAIWRSGFGASLPNNADVQSVSFGVDLSEPPDSIVACSGPVLFQSKLKLENVMRDTDLQYKKANDVSYKPSGGWLGADPFHPIAESEPVLSQHLAAEDYCRKWRPVSQADGSLDVPGYGQSVPDMEHLRPIFDTLADSYTNDDGVQQRKPAYLEGTVAIGGEPNSLENSADFEVIEVPFRVDAETGIIDTGKIPLVKLTSLKEQTFADVYLVCSYYVLDSQKFNAIRYAVSRNIANNGTGAFPVDCPDIQIRYIAEYSGTNKASVSSVSDNKADSEAAMNARIDSAQGQFQPSASHVVRYRNLQPISPDGAIRQVTWIVQCGEPGNEGGAWTIAYRNTETEPGIPIHRERRRSFAVDREASRRQSLDHSRWRALRRGLR